MSAADGNGGGERTSAVASSAGAVLCAVFAGARLAQPGTWLIGSPGAEVYGHAWVQGWVAEAWPRLPAETTALDAHPTAWRVIDPAITWFAAGLSKVVGPIAAWNGTALLAVAGAFLGGWFLASRIGGNRWVGAISLGLAPAFAGVLTSGLTEDWALGLLAVALALVYRMETPRNAVLAGLAVGSLAWTGLYLALMGALGAAVLAIPQLRTPRHVVLAALIALAVALPAAALQGARLGGETHRSGVPIERSEPHWRLNPHHGADLASFVTPGPDPVDDGALIRVHPGYLGLSVLILAALAPPGGRRWWALVGVALLLAPGPSYRFAGDPLGIPNPAVALAAHLPLIGLVNHWGRLLLLAAVGLAAAASLGAARAPRAAPVIIALDLLLLSPRPFPLPVADGSLPEIVTRLGDLPEGALVVVPSAGPGVAFQRILYEQRGHGRPVMVSPNRPGYGAAEGVPLVRWFAGLPGERKDPPDPEVDTSLRRLDRLGVGAIVVREPYVADVEALLGAPDVRAADGAAWAVTARPRPPGTAPKR